MENGNTSLPEQFSFLNETSIALLESQWGELPQAAYSENGSSGWTIHLKGTSPVFSQAGFHPVEVVPAEALLKCAGSFSQRGLVERLLAIFEHIRPPENAS